MLHTWIPLILLPLLATGWSSPAHAKEAMHRGQTIPSTDTDMADIAADGRIPDLLRHYSYVTSPGKPIDPSRIEVLSWDKPRVFVYRNLLTPAETELIRRSAEDTLVQSRTVDPDGDANDVGVEELSVRTSSDTFVYKGKQFSPTLLQHFRSMKHRYSHDDDEGFVQRRRRSANRNHNAQGGEGGRDDGGGDKGGRQVGGGFGSYSGSEADVTSDLIVDIERRIATLVHLDRSRGEPFNVLRYGEGQQYKQHNDYIENDALTSASKGLNRVTTSLIYLTDVVEGGETEFPEVGGKKFFGLSVGGSPCGKALGVTPRDGDALLFFDSFPDGTMDDSSDHRSCPVLFGVKWSMTSWNRMLPIDPDLRLGSSDALVYGFACPELPLCKERNNFNRVGDMVCQARMPYAENDSRVENRLDCPLTCGYCIPRPFPPEFIPHSPAMPPVPCPDLNENCRDWANKGECTKNAPYMNVNCKESCRVPCVVKNKRTKGRTKLLK